MKKHPLVKDILFTREQIQIRTKEVVGDIEEFYAKETVAENSLLLVGLLKGCVPFFAEVMANLEMNCETDFMVVSSYRGGTKTTGEPKILLDVNTTLSGRDILIVEDIVDSGYTLEYVKKYFYGRGAKSVRILTLLDKPSGRKADLKSDWNCFTIENEFVIGYGLDYQEKLRNLPYVATCDTSKLDDWKW
ncbi:hypoxanthine phosphoribosyltransferase [[Acholeplasma] multilocale]|uniref:hypoxanthine phosphoribosyltransferase n=1 Tax=[Acholeplasma] multilocale TaxID=264638 RepID=UPI00047A5D5B|nr:hypoxanthine phosphoribosyltransferase [[Acholeplasma] multilocale]